MTAGHSSSGRPLPDCATIEHPRSEHHPLGRDRKLVSLSHYRCNHLYNRVELALKQGHPLDKAEEEWLDMVAGKLANQKPVIRRNVERLLRKRDKLALEGANDL